MKRQFILFFALSLILTSCFDVIEELTLNEDGSGTFEYTLNMSQSARELNSIRQLDSFKNYTIPTEESLNTDIDKGLKILKTCNGISNINLEKDYENYVFRIRVHFDSLQNLNKAIQTVFSSMSGRPLPFNASFHFNGNQFVRKSNFHRSGAFKDLNRQNRKILSSSNYTTIYRLPYLVEHTSHNRARISGNKKAVMIRANLLDMVDGKNNISNVIQTQ